MNPRAARLQRLTRALEWQDHLAEAIMGGRRFTGSKLELRL
jgi:hypothetical protein